MNLRQLAIACAALVLAGSVSADAREPFATLTPLGQSESYGASVAVSGAGVAVGAPSDTTFNTSNVSSIGTVRLKDATDPQFESVFRPFDATGFDRFGEAVAVQVFGGGPLIGGGKLLVGAPRHFADPNAFFGEVGAVYAFDLTSGQQTRKLSPPSTITTDGARFGSAVAMEGSLAVIGAPRSGQPVIGSEEFGYLPGDAFVYDHGSGAQVSRLTPSVRADNDRFGAAVAIADGVALVGAPEPEGGAGPFVVGPVPAGTGAAYLFDAATGVQSSRLLADDGAAGDLFGSAVAIADGLALVGAPGHRTDGLTLSGAAYLYDVASGTQLAKFASPAPEGGGRFGVSVALGDGVAAIGASFEDAAGQNSGATYLFDLATRTLLDSITPPAGASFGFGSAVAIDEGVLVATATNATLPAPGVARAYRLIPEPTAAVLALTAVAALARRRA